MPFAKITKKGQVTIPVAFRKKLGTDVVRIEMEGDRVVITPARELGGVFQKYAFRDRSIEEVMELEKKAMEEAFAGEKELS
ncbi:MAG: AbrB/MazE/SpoVT family DNA-binding domain-containing protein [Aquificota bacterium]|nr:MAG: AbrB/MazE/SpoVT family DNA-binding domain-containing protein [Aquificota bacterium]